MHLTHFMFQSVTVTAFFCAYAAVHGSVTKRQVTELTTCPTTRPVTLRDTQRDAGTCGAGSHARDQGASTSVADQYDR